MRFFPETNIDFIGLRKVTFFISLILIVLGIYSIFIQKGLKLGIEFTGGIEKRLKFEEPVSVKVIREALSEIGLGKAIIQSYGERKENLIRIRVGVEETGREKLSLQIEKAIEKKMGKENSFEVLSTELIGPAITKEFRNKALWAVGLALLGMLIYIALRFDFKFGIGAVVALAHDTIITLGVLSLGGYELSLPVIAALLTIIGYSLNDTIVIYDRIRENIKGFRKKKKSLQEVINLSINQSLARTTITSLTTLLVVLVLYLKGGEVLKAFSFALLVGVMVGTYSSDFVASPIVYQWSKES